MIGETLGQRFYLDANFFIYVLEESEPWAEAARRILISLDRGECEAVTSELSLAECLVKPLELGRTEIAEVYLEFLRDRRSLLVVPVSREVLIEAARLRAQNRIKPPDAVHGATALQGGCASFLTNDDRLNIPGIQMVRWGDLQASPSGE
ncbi:MAG TPA: type II toxin-antitoxin system VapC family toxin [Thermoanaerobaculia bacterium]|nr:type II toxin-antitoxin system VapC family toxin [Thermoanaerobaculia bacterium]